MALKRNKSKVIFPDLSVIESHHFLGISTVYLTSDLSSPNRFINGKYYQPYYRSSIFRHISCSIKQIKPNAALYSIFLHHERMEKKKRKLLEK
uniref:Uncharacterized protein n=1 Tax=Onchocerca volvulus TaxID=6282 RepID=A0A8R1XPN5_ONCVO